MANIFHTPYTVTQPYGPTTFDWEPAYGGYPHYHRGIDLVGVKGRGCPVYAAGPGTVRYAGSDPTGTYVIILRDDGYWEAHWHLDAITAWGGTRVDNTVQIGTMGSTGRSTGAHVHLEVCKPGAWRGLLAMTPVNPLPYLRDAAQGGADEMNYDNFVRLAYARFRLNEQPTDEVLQAHAEYIRSGYPADEWLYQFVTSAGWKSGWDWNKTALAFYADATGRGDGNPERWALDRLEGGSDFSQVIHSDMAAAAQQERSLKERIATQEQEIQRLSSLPRETESSTAPPKKDSPSEVKSGPPVQEVIVATPKDPIVAPVNLPSDDLTRDEIGFIKRLYLFFANALLGR